MTIPWWQMHPVIAPLPKGFLDEDTSRAEAREWMARATAEIERLEGELRRADYSLSVLRAQVELLMARPNPG